MVAGVAEKAVATFAALGIAVACAGKAERHGASAGDASDTGPPDVSYPSCRNADDCHAEEACDNGVCAPDAPATGPIDDGSLTDLVEAGPDTCRELGVEDGCGTLAQSSEYANGLCHWIQTYRVSDVADCARAEQGYACEFRWGSDAGTTPTVNCGNHGVWWRMDGSTLVVSDSALQEQPEDWQRCTTTEQSDECACACEALVEATGE